MQVKRSIFVYPSLQGLMMQRKSELLLPGGSLTKAKTAILYGADAVYAGTPDMSLRTRARMSLEELVEGARFAHDHGKKIYLTLNLFTHNKDAQKLPQLVDTIKKANPDGVIVADPGGLPTSRNTPRPSTYTSRPRPTSALI